jgi:hypothetical protein
LRRAAAPPAPVDVEQLEEPEPVQEAQVAGHGVA